MKGCPVHTAGNRCAVCSLAGRMSEIPEPSRVVLRWSELGSRGMRPKPWIDEGWLNRGAQY